MQWLRLLVPKPVLGTPSWESREELICPAQTSGAPCADDLDLPHHIVGPTSSVWTDSNCAVRACAVYPARWEMRTP